EDVVDGAVAVGGVVAGRHDVRDRVERVEGGARHVVGREGRVDDLQQTLGRGALGGVGVPVVDGVRVAGRLAHDVAVDAVVGARDAVLLHDRQRLADPAVEVVRVRRRGGGGGRGGRGRGGAGGADERQGDHGGAGAGDGEGTGETAAAEAAGHTGCRHVRVSSPAPAR